MSALGRAMQWLGNHGAAISRGFLPLVAGERKQQVYLGGTRGTFTWGSAAPTATEPNGSVYWQFGATVPEEVFWFRQGGAWARVNSGMSAVQAYNDTGGAHAAGTVVYVSGADDTNDLPEVTEADASDPTKLPMAVATEDVSDASAGSYDGYWLQSSIDTSTWVGGVGTKGYADPASPGGYTETKPTGADEVAQVVCVLVEKHATTGKILWVPGLAIVEAVGTSYLQPKGVTPAKVALTRGAMLRGTAGGASEELDLSTLGMIPVGDGNDPAAAQLPSAGLLAMPTANTFAGRSIAVDAGSATALGVADPDGVAGNPTLSVQAVLEDLATLGAASGAGEMIVATGAGVFAYQSGGTLRTSIGLGTSDSPEFADLLLTGNLVVQGSSILAQLESIELEANWLTQNLGYTTAVAVTGGRVLNVLPTATQDVTTGSGVVTPGVLGVSDPTITTDGAATFALNDIVMISGSDNDGENDGLYEVVSHAANLLTLRGGLTPTVEGFSSGQLVANAGDLGMAVTKINVAADRAGTDGRFEAAYGSASGLTYSDYLMEADLGSGLQVAAHVASVKPDSTTGGTVIPVDVGANGVGLDVATVAAAVADGTINVATDELLFRDADDSSKTKRETIADLATAMAGANLTATNGVLAASTFDIGGLTNAAMAAGDAIAFADADNANNPKKRLWSEVLTMLAAGTGIKTSGTGLAVDLNECTNDVFQPSGDRLAFIDATGGDATKRDNWRDMAALMAGSGIFSDGSTGVFSLSGWAVQKQKTVIAGGNGAGNVGDLNTAPVEVVPAGGANTIIVVEDVTYKWVYAAAAYDGAGAGDDLVLRYTTSHAEVTGDVDNGNGGAIRFARAGAGTDYACIKAAIADVTPPVNEGVELFVRNNDPFNTTGGGSLEVTVTYRIIDVS